MAREPHPLAGQEVTIADGQFAGDRYRVEDWWQNVTGKSWMACDGNPACIEYAVRSACEHLPCNNDVVYGHISGLGYLIHASQLPASQRTETGDE